MSDDGLSIPRQPGRSPAADYYALRRDGIGFIEQMGSALWTDYNTHDPGITIHEGMCYAITELAYRIGWDIKDLLVPAGGGEAPAQPFFSAREILTVNPVTPDDWRRLLVGLAGVRNAWVSCKECACDVVHYAWCAPDGQPKLGWRRPAGAAEDVHRIDVRGMIEALVELEADPEAGDLDERKAERDATLPGTRASLALEMRFPDWELARPGEWQTFLGPGSVSKITLARLGARKDYDLFGDPLLDDEGRDRYLRAHWKGALYASFTLTVEPGGLSLPLEQVALHLFGDNAARGALTASGLKALLEDAAADGLVARYRAKARKAAAVLAAARARLHAHRNLDEDFCRVAAIGVEDVAVCADIEVAADADIELVQAQAWLAIERYFNPPLPRYRLQELLDEGVPVEDIFDGPQADGGFIKPADLAASRLRQVLRGSDLVNLLMDIDGVRAVNGLLLTGYDDEGNPVAGAADPVQAGGVFVFDPNKTSAAWQLFVTPLRQPRLYQRRSRFLFFKNGLPFSARADEAAATLLRLRGEAERPGGGEGADDLAVPRGRFRDPAAYYPVQYSFPRAWGIGPEGLPATAPPLRRAQAHQLQAYLMVFEQLLANANAQLAHVADLFSLDPAVGRTYFAGRLGPDVIAAWKDVVDTGLTPSALDALLETPRQFQERRNRFLDHLLARFGEDFREYALLLTSRSGEQVGLDRLVGDKLAFLAAYPAVSRDRARAFDWTRRPDAPDNLPGIKRRVSLLLGYPELDFWWSRPAPATVDGYELRDRGGRAWLAGSLLPPASGADDQAAVRAAWDAVVGRMSLPGAWEVTPGAGGFDVLLRDAAGAELGRAPAPLASAGEAHALVAELLAWSADARAIVVEHLLLRPKFPGDALFPVCADGPCAGCGVGDPYSFRLSFVMPGWVAPFDADLALRGFADRTIAQELPSHLLAKVCWVGNDDLADNPCDPVVAGLAGLLEQQGTTAGGGRPDAQAACAGARAILSAFAAVFREWYPDRMFDYIAPPALAAALEALFAAKPAPGGIAGDIVMAPPVFDQVRARMVVHFAGVASDGWQFDRFARAWRAWLLANAAFDWSSERLQDRVEAILASGLTGTGRDALCACAAGIVTARGEQFDAWLESNIAADRRPGAFTPFTPAPAAPCPGLLFAPDTFPRVEALLAVRYAAYAGVSYWLRVVLRLLAGLRNVYPGATLHDCVEGGDLNPVRLGSTTLGSTARRARADEPPET
jgi:hypothetical protein